MECRNSHAPVWRFLSLVPSNLHADVPYKSEGFWASATLFQNTSSSSIWSTLFLKVSSRLFPEAPQYTALNHLSFVWTWNTSLCHSLAPYYSNLLSDIPQVRAFLSSFPTKSKPWVQSLCWPIVSPKRGHRLLLCIHNRYWVHTPVVWAREKSKVTLVRHCLGVI